MASVDVQLASSADDLPAVAELRCWAGAALAARPRAELTVRIVDEAEGAELNHTFRARSGATNVLSFGADLPPGVDIDLLGDIVICAPVVLAEARAQGKTARAHYAHMVVHGTLHLLGHDHGSDSEAQAMETLECAILGRLGFADPYQG